MLLTLIAAVCGMCKEQHVCFQFLVCCRCSTFWAMLVRAPSSSYAPCNEGHQWLTDPLVTLSIVISHLGGHTADRMAGIAVLLDHEGAA